MQTLKDQITQPLYEYMEIERGGTYHFFQTPIGANKGGKFLDVDGDTYERTNMWCAGMLPAGNQFLLQGIRVAFFPGQSVYAEDDVQTLYSNGALRLVIGSRDYLNLGPLAMFPPLIEVYPKIRKKPAALARFGYFALEPKIFIDSRQCFRVTLSINSRLRLNAVGRLGVILDGLLVRDCS